MIAKVGNSPVFVFSIILLLSGLILGSFPKNKKVRFFLVVLLVLDHFIYCKLFLKFNLYFLNSNLIISLILIFFNKYTNFLFFLKNFSLFNKLKTYLVSSLLVSFILLCFSFLFFLKFSYFNYSNTLSNTHILYPKLNLNFSINIFHNSSNMLIYLSFDFFSFIILFLAYLVGFFSLITLDSRLYWNNFSYIFFFNLFIIIVFFFVSVSNILAFFFFYELLLLPSFFFVYFVSPSRRAVQASFYFLLWTQIGSFIVLFAISYITFMSNSFDFYSLKMFNFTNNEIYFIYILLFLGFGIKVPIWPFHYWITKTHVEAPSGFSIYLSGFLVKSALFGFYKLTNLISFLPNSSFFLMITILGIVDASIKMWGQTDLKKLVAYCTIQEMNLIFLLFCFGDLFLKEIGFLFSLTHAFLSTLMFYIVDCIYRRFHSRSILQVNGIVSFLPNLAITIFFMCIFFAGLPGTLKFSVEFCLFNNLLDFSIALTILSILIANCLGLIGFSKNWFNLLFGTKKNFFIYIQNDLSYKEIIINYSIFFFLIVFSFFPNFLM